MTSVWHKEYIQHIIEQERSRRRFILGVWAFMTVFLLGMYVFMSLSIELSFHTFLPLFTWFSLTFAILAGMKPPGVSIHKSLWQFWSFEYFIIEDYNIFKLRPTLNEAIGAENYYLVGGNHPMVVVCRNKKLAVLAKMVL